jgi:hypothetical protein
MSRFSKYLLQGFGKFEISESVSRTKILDIVDMVLKVEKALPEVIDNIANPKWHAYIKDFRQQCTNVADLLMR